jgi:hypothetical protein
MINMPPRDDRDYTEQREEVHALFVIARRRLETGQHGYICHALTGAAREQGLTGDDARHTEAHAVIISRLGTDEDGTEHTFRTWWRAQNNNIHPRDCMALRLQWLDDLIKEFE